MFVFPTGVDVVNSGTWRGFNEETVLARTEATVPDGGVSVTLQVALGEAGPMAGRQIIPMIRDFADYTKSIIAIFDT